MELPRLIAALSDPAVYPRSAGVDAVEARQTHISVVLLAGRHAYKVKKPLVCGFLDYGSLERRRQSCEEEVRVNRRLAPTVYLGVVPITREGTSVRMEGRGEVVEWAVKMERLPEEATLRNQLRRGRIGVPQVEALACRIAEFHARAGAGPLIAASGRFDVISGNALANFEESAAHVGTTVSRPVFDRLRALTDRRLAELRPLIEDRAGRGVPRDGHGDFRLDHVYLFPDLPAGADLVIIDGIEFNERFRFGDPVADLAFLVMDFLFQDRRDLAKSLADAYFQASGDKEGRILLPFYVAYRAAVRGKVEGMELAEPEIPQADRDAALVRARAHWLLALGESEDQARRPCLLLVGGLPGSGKSILARGLAERAGFSAIRSDRVRKELAGLAPGATAASPFESGIYTPEWTARTYAACLRRAEALLFQGGRVWWTRASARKRTAACSWRPPSAGPSRPACSSAARRPMKPDPDSRAAGATFPTPTGQPTGRLRSAGRSRARSPSLSPNRSQPPGARRKRCRGPWSSSEGSASSEPRTGRSTCPGFKLFLLDGV